jgi:hypothetical protein
MRGNNRGAAIPALIGILIFILIITVLLSGRPHNQKPRLVGRIDVRMEQMDVVKLDVTLPVSISPDCVKKVVTVGRTPAGPYLPSESIEVGPNVEQIGVWAAQDAKVSIEVVAVDDAGNESIPKLWMGYATDTVAPVLEGEVEATSVDEDTVDEDAVGIPGIEVDDSGDGAEPQADVDKLED